MGWTGTFKNPLAAGRKEIADCPGKRIVAESGHWFLVERMDPTKPNGFERRAIVVLTDAGSFKTLYDVEHPYADGFPVEWLDVLTPDPSSFYHSWLSMQLARAEERARESVAAWLAGVRKQGLLPAGAAL